MFLKNIRFHDSFRVFLSQTNNLKQASKQESESMSKLKEVYDAAKSTMNNNVDSIEYKQSQFVMDYNEAIKVDNQPRELYFLLAFTFPFSQWHPSIFKVKDITFYIC